MRRWYAPLDPECPAVNTFYNALHNDALTQAYGAPVDDISDGFERRHRTQCKRCQEYGARNMDVRED